MTLSDQMGKDMYRCIVDLFPLCRSIVGDGLRETLHRLQRRFPLTIQGCPMSRSCAAQPFRVIPGGGQRSRRGRAPSGGDVMGDGEWRG